MRLQPWFSVLAALTAAGTVHAQQNIGVGVGVGGERLQIPGLRGYGLSQGVWGVSATVELRSVRIPHFALITRIEYTPERAASADPGMLSIGSGVRYTLAAGRHVTLRPSAEFAAMRFPADAYNASLRPYVTAPCRYMDLICGLFNYYGEGLLVEEGWRLGLSLRPALQVWPIGWVGFEFTPAVRWLVPVSRSLPPGDHDPYADPVYLSLGVGMVLWLRG